MLMAWRGGGKGAWDEGEVTGDGRAHKFMVKVSDDFTRRAANIIDEVFDGWEDIIFERVDRTNIFDSSGPINSKKGVLDATNA